MKSSPPIPAILLATLAFFLVTTASTAAPDLAYVTEFKLIGIQLGDSGAARDLMRNTPGPITEERLKQLLAIKGANVLSAPRIATRVGQEGSISVQKAESQYFEKTRDYYTLRTLERDKAPGVFITMRVDPSANASPTAINLAADVRVNVLIDRVKLDGVELDVGQPLLSSREVKFSMPVKLNTWHLLSALELHGGQASPTNALIVLAHVKPMDAPPKVQNDGGHDFKRLEARSNRRESSADGSLIRLQGNVSITLDDRRLTADEVEIKALNEDSGSHFKADQIQFDANTGSMILSGNVEITHGSSVIRSKRATLSPSNLVTLSIDADGNILLKNQQLPKNNLDEALRTAGAGPETTVIISAHKQTPFKVVTQLIESLNAIGVERVSFKTESPIDPNRVRF